MEVKAWKEIVTIPTYGIGKPEKNPVFLEKRIYQGSSGVVYPHPVIEKIYDEKINKDWNAVYLENQYLKIMILPELGGRVQMAFDKIKNRHFIYYNQVIKPALVGLTGPWISGGIEFNWPQHHRPSTFEPIDHYIENNQDGSVTVWCSEVERMFRTKGMAGFTLYPDKAYLEIKVKLYNRTPFPQTFLWWANPAVKVNDEYQSVFPPDVHAVFDHGKRDVSEFPIAKGTYYKVNYSPGTDISRYKNIPVPTSYMAITSKYNFVGGYENDSKGGLLHVANHHVSPGKKQWTWGNSDFGKAWDRNLTDEDGPYIELMCGVFTDNQPDFSWIMPGEEKTFSQYFMPYRDLGVVKNATKEAMVNLEFMGNKATLKAFTTAVYADAKVKITLGGKPFFSEAFDFNPSVSFDRTIELPSGINKDEVEVAIFTSDNIELVSWKPGTNSSKDIPKPAKAAQQPSEIENNEQLYLTGLHLEQYRHATYDPRDYYLEALRRDPKDSRCNNAMGLWFMRRGKFAEAEKYFRKAIETLTERNPNPADGEPFYNLGLALRFQLNHREAYDAFYKSVWNDAFMATGYFQLAQIECISGRFSDALELIDRALVRNWHNHTSRHLKACILRKLGRTHEAQKLIKYSLCLDFFNYGIQFEKVQLSPFEADILSTMKETMRNNIHTYIEYSLDYSQAGFFKEAIELINLGIEEQKATVYPLALYFKAWFEARNNDRDASIKTLQLAAKACPDYCFPNQPEAKMVLEWAAEQNPADGMALYYLGNYWYNGRQYDDAVKCWEQSVLLNPDFPITHRNLALAYFNKFNKQQKALEELEKTFSLGENDSRILMELDQLYKRMNVSPEKRLERLEKYIQLVNDRDDLYLELISLNNYIENYEKAYDLLLSRNFHPWEGGEGKVIGEYIFTLTEIAKKAISTGEFETAVNILAKAQVYPENLGEGKLYGAQENSIFYWLGCAYSAMGNTEKAEECWIQASTGISEPSAAMFYNDQQPDTIYFQGLSLQKLGKNKEAQERFNKLIDYGKTHLNDQVRVNFFAVSLPDMLIWEDDLNKRNSQLCQYLMGLGYLGIGETEKALQLYNDVINSNRYHAFSRFNNDLKDAIKG